MSEPNVFQLPASEQFAQVLNPTRREPKHRVDDEDYVAFVLRALRGLEARSLGNATLLPQMILVAQRAAEAVNTAIAVNAERFALDPAAGASMGECARAVGITKQSASQRRQIGERIMAERIREAGGVSFSEAKRERAAIKKAAEHAAEAMPEYIGRHTPAAVVSLHDRFQRRAS